MTLVPQKRGQSEALDPQATMAWDLEVPCLSLAAHLERSVRWFGEVARLVLCLQYSQVCWGECLQVVTPRDP